VSIRRCACSSVEYSAALQFRLSCVYDTSSGKSRQLSDTFVLFPEGAYWKGNGRFRPSLTPSLSLCLQITIEFEFNWVFEVLWACLSQLVTFLSVKHKPFFSLSSNSLCTFFWNVVFVKHLSCLHLSNLGLFFVNRNNSIKKKLNRFW
jgi:hypothetical protein